MRTLNVIPWLKQDDPDSISLVTKPKKDYATGYYAYTSDGRMDFPKYIASLERSFETDMGLRLNLVSGAMHDPEFMGGVKDGIIENAILCTENILKMFSPVEGSLQSTKNTCTITLAMLRSNMLVQIPIRRDAKGGYDVTAVIAALEQSYREVLFMDSGEVIFSSGQRQVMRAKAPAWLDGLLEQAGVAMPEVVLDTENVVWQANGLKMKVTVSAPESVGVAGREYALIVPLIEGGKGDYSVIEPLAKKITTDWLKENACLCSEAVYKAVYEPMQEVAPAYVQWVIAETQKDVQRFWDAFNAELNKKLELVKKFEKEAVEYVGKLKSETLKAAEPEIGATPGVIKGLLWAFPRIWRGLFAAAPKIGAGLKTLLDEAPRHLNDHAEDMVKGLLFGITAAGWVMVETAWMVVKDVAAVAGPGIAVKLGQWGAKKAILNGVSYKLLPPIANPSAKTTRYIGVGEQIASGVLSTASLIDFCFSTKETAERIARINLKIKKMVYGDDD